LEVTWLPSRRLESWYWLSIFSTAMLLDPDSGRKPLAVFWTITREFPIRHGGYFSIVFDIKSWLSLSDDMAVTWNLDRTIVSLTMFHLRRISKTIINPRQSRRIPIIYSSAQRLQSTSTPESRSTRNCPKCGALLPTTLPTCINTGCGYIEPIPKELRSDYYAMFGFPSIRDSEKSQNPFKIDPKALRRRFLDMQKVCHPDRWAQSGKVWTSIIVITRYW